MRIPGRKLVRDTLRWSRSRGTRRAAVLGYHRVADTAWDPFDLAIRPGEEEKPRLVTSRGAWVSRWFCLFRLADPVTGRSHPCLVCASRNTPDSYRRLLVLLRMRGEPGTGMLAW